VIYGEKIRLRSIEEIDLPQLANWRNQPELRHRTREYRLLSEQDQVLWFKSLATDESQMLFVVETHYDRLAMDPPDLDSALGVAGWTNINWRDSSAELSIYIGAPEARGKGFGRDVVNTLLGYAFEEMSLYRVWLEVYEFNQAGVNLFKKCGFQEEGRLRDAVYRKGRRWDSIIMSMLRMDYAKVAPINYLKLQENEGPKDE